MFSENYRIHTGKSFLEIIRTFPEIFSEVPRIQDWNTDIDIQVPRGDSEPNEVLF
jgi:hypothetical protein